MLKPLLLTFAAICIALSSVPVSHAQPRVAINEIMYAPVAPEPEWVEIYNPETTSIDLTGYEITNLSKVAALPSLLLSSGSYVVLTKDSTALRKARPGNYAVLQLKLPTLRNSGDFIVLRDQQHQTVDSLHYSPAQGGSGGKSLERKNYLRSATITTNWATSTNPFGATPGTANSQLPASYDLGIDSLGFHILADTLTVALSISNRGIFDVASGRIDVWYDATPGILAERTVPPISADSVATLLLSLPAPLKGVRTLFAAVRATGDTTYSNDTARINLPLGGQLRSIVINEIMAAPTKPEPEWIELLNTTHDSVNMSNWMIGVGHSTRQLPIGLHLIPPDSMIILTSDDTALSRVRKVPIDRCIRFPLPTLSNTGSDIELRDLRNDLIDSATYRAAVASVSFERKDYFASGTDSANWSLSEDSTGSTILRPNSNRVLEIDGSLMCRIDTPGTLTLAVHNAGRAPILGASIKIRRATLDSFTITTSLALPGNRDTLLYWHIPEDVYGQLYCSANIAVDGDLRSANDTSNFVIATPIPQDSIRINEILFQPKVGGCEWIELYNATSRFISLDSCTLVTGSSLRSSYALYPIRIPSYDYGLIAANSAFFTEHPELQSRETIDVIGKSSLGLTKDSCKVALIAYNNSQLDSVEYFGRWHSAAYSNTTGISLERKAWTGPSNSASNWTSSFDATGSTPLRGNSQQPTVVATTGIVECNATPNPFSPDADGFEDVTQISILTGDNDAYIGRVRIFDARGMAVRTLLDNSPVTNAAQLTFDGKRDDGRYLPPGLYMVVVELNSLDHARNLIKRIGLAIAAKRQ